MDEKTYKITLSDGTVLDGLKLNGNNFISDVPVDASIFGANCSPVIINDGETSAVHEHMELVQVTEVNGKSWFILRDITEKELKQARLEANIEYIAMMCDIPL